MVRSDLPLILAWRNHISVRSYMYSQHEISIAEHESWYEKSISDSNHHLLIFEYEGEPIGFVKLVQIENTKDVDWGFYAAPHAPVGTGRNLGYAGLRYGFEELGLLKINGQALKHNERSIKMHLALGFKQTSSKETTYFDGKEYHQIVAFSILRDDWMQSNNK
jgi:UDP-4-amino-4,6-dideoxy-N-acetyl-beta-L-altrosamine N-acetyltransferase